jgi:hypothetical protein
MPQVGYEPTIPVFERAKTDHGLDRAAIAIDKFPELRIKIVELAKLNCIRNV